jgi:hypothetical protein
MFAMAPDAPVSRADVLSDLRGKLCLLSLAVVGLEAVKTVGPAECAGLTDLIHAAQQDVDQLEGNDP